MLRYAASRMLGALPVVAVVALAVFMLLHISPGDPAAVIGGDDATAADIARIRVQLGLDRPLYEQFVLWLGRIATGDLGTSIYSGQPVLAMIARRVEPTIVLAVTTTVVSVAVAVPVGVHAARRVDSWLDHLVMGFAVFGFSIPVFILGYGLIWLLAIHLEWLPVQGYSPLAHGLGGTLESIAAAVLALSISNVALLARVTRATMLDILQQDYMRTAVAKGLPGWRVLFRHALANGAIPIVTTVGISFAMLLSGVVVAETVFGIPGVGRLTVDAILRRDYPVIQGVTLLFAMVYVLVNLCVDLSYVLFDPRVRY